MSKRVSPNAHSIGRICRGRKGHILIVDFGDTSPPKSLQLAGMSIFRMLLTSVVKLSPWLHLQHFIMNKNV